MNTILHLGHPDAGFVYLVLNQLNEYADPVHLPTPLPLDGEHELPSTPYSVIVPIQTPQDVVEKPESCEDGLRQIAVDVNEGRARVLFDRSNEAAGTGLLDRIHQTAHRTGK